MSLLQKFNKVESKIKALRQISLVCLVLGMLAFLFFNQVTYFKAAAVVFLSIACIAIVIAALVDSLKFWRDGSKGLAVFAFFAQMVFLTFVAHLLSGFIAWK